MNTRFLVRLAALFGMSTGGLSQAVQSIVSSMPKAPAASDPYAWMLPSQNHGFIRRASQRQIRRNRRRAHAAGDKRAFKRPMTDQG